MMPDIALDMFRGNFPFPPNFIFFYCVGENAALSTTSPWEIAVSRSSLQKPYKPL